MINKSYLIILLFIISAHTFAQKWVQVSRVTAPKKYDNDYFAEHVDISGDYAVAASTRHAYDLNESNFMSCAGAVYLYKRSASDGSWEFSQKLVSPNRSANYDYGAAINISGDYLAVYEKGEVNRGTVYIYKRNTSNKWILVQTITAPDAADYDCFGKSLSISGNTMLVGSPWTDTDADGKNYLQSAGAVYVYTRDPATDMWVFQQKITESTRSDNGFGFFVDLSGNSAVVSLYQGSYNSLYIIEKDTTTNLWAVTQQINEPGKLFLSNSNNWGNVAIDGDYFIVSGYVYGGAGIAYIFKRNASSGQWVFLQSIEASDKSSGDFFGQRVDVKGNIIVAGAYMDDGYSGAAYIFKNDTITGTWTEFQKIVASPRDSKTFGQCLAVSNVADSNGKCNFWRDKNKIFFKTKG